jgi:outer membrane receptor protein involved in Fe transport
VAAGIGGPAEAAPQRIRFHVEPKRYSEALLDVAQQANVTLIGAGACQGGVSAGLGGVMTLEEALSRVLTGAPCRWRLVAAGTIEVTPLPREEARMPPLTTVSELLVTATKRNRDPRQLAVAVTALPRGQLATTGAVDIDEAAGQLPGVLATNLGPGRNKLILRGISDGAYTGRAKSTVSTYLDDLPLNYNAPDPDLRLVDVERVEVARGPQGALYGSGSLSGVYRIVARKPDLERYAAGARVTGAATTGGSNSYSAEGYVNLAPWNDVLALRVAGYDEVQGG